MIFQFSDGEFSDPISTSLKIWKKSIVLSLFAFSVTLEKLNRNPQAFPPAPPLKIFLHAFFFSPPTRKLAARSLLCLCGEFFGCTPRHDHYRIRRCGSCEWRERWVGCVVWRLLDQTGTIMIFGIANVSMKHDVAVCLQIRC